MPLLMTSVAPRTRYRVPSVVMKEGMRPATVMEPFKRANRERQAGARSELSQSPARR